MGECENRSLNHSNNMKNPMPYPKLSITLAAALLTALTGCLHAPRTAGDSLPPDYVEGAVLVQDDYVYYPGYQIYYNSRRNQYLYQEGRSWVARPAPPRVAVDVLRASPSVRLDFHDAPEIHHSQVVQQYPKQWKPPGDNPTHGKEGQNNGKGLDRGDRR